MKKEIGTVLKEYRTKAGLTVKDVSILLSKKGYKASEKTVYSWECGNSRPTPEALLEMCDIYNIDNILETFGYIGYSDDGNIKPNYNEIDMISKYRALDTHGKDIVDTVLDKEYDRVCEAAAKDDYLMPIAAHQRTDIEVTDEMIQHDNDLMDNFDNF